MSGEKSNTTPEMDAALIKIREENEREGFEEIPGMAGLALNIFCERHAEMYEGCDKEHVVEVMTGTFFQVAAEAISDTEKLTEYLKEFSARGEYVCCTFPDSMHAELIAKSKAH